MRTGRGWGGQDTLVQSCALPARQALLLMTGCRLPVSLPQSPFSPVPLAGDKLVKLVYEALDTATSADTVHQEELAAKRVLDKAHVKVGRRLGTPLL